MSRTKRKDWKNDSIRDGKHGKKCPEPNCNYCMNGKFNKKWYNRLTRRKKIDREL